MEKLIGKTALVTGSTDGVGRLVARELGQAGARVLVHGHDSESGARVVADIEASGGAADFLAADLSALAEVRSLADAAQATVDRLDILISNAGIGTAGLRQTSAEGIMFTIDLGAALEGTGVTVTCLHPATYMDTSMVRRAGVRPLSTVEEGARAILNHEARAQAQAYDPDARRQLQALSLELTGLSAEDVVALER
jgi:NAD(P)-dependent dehydrogenase (short-subunit alcohol dehydrogenase family)